MEVELDPHCENANPVPAYIVHRQTWPIAPPAAAAALQTLE